MRFRLQHVLLLAGSLSGGLEALACDIRNSQGEAVHGLSDPLFVNLSPAPCPRSVTELRQILKDNDAESRSTMVANRGFQDPNSGSFSFFEMVESVAARDAGRRFDRDE